MPIVVRGACLDKGMLQYDKDGQLVDSKKIREIIFRGVSIVFIQ
jgi:hypothetical protein